MGLFAFSDSMRQEFVDFFDFLRLLRSSAAPPKPLFEFDRPHEAPHTTGLYGGSIRVRLLDAAVESSNPPQKMQKLRSFVKFLIISWLLSKYFDKILDKSCNPIAPRLYWSHQARGNRHQVSGFGESPKD